MTYAMNLTDGKLNSCVNEVWHFKAMGLNKPKLFENIIMHVEQHSMFYQDSESQRILIMNSPESIWEKNKCTLQWVHAGNNEGTFGIYSWLKNLSSAN